MKNVSDSKTVFESTLHQSWQWKRKVIENDTFNTKKLSKILTTKTSKREIFSHLSAFFTHLLLVLRQICSNNDIFFQDEAKISLCGDHGRRREWDWIELYWRWITERESWEEWSSRVRKWMKREKWLDRYTSVRMAIDTLTTDRLDRHRPAISTQAATSF